MRIAYVGLSTPLFYDYHFPATKAPSDLSSSPNPILDSSFGIMLLFDEIWFLCRSLCPDNMRSLSYVKFMDEQDLLPPIEDIKFPDLYEAIKNNKELLAEYNDFHDVFKTYDKSLKSVGYIWGRWPDNHSHGLKLGNVIRSANSVRIENILFDIEVVTRLRNKNVELITNRFSHRWLQTGSNPFLQTHVTELLVIDNIPNYLSRHGPYHPCIEEACENQYLKDFRKWIVQQRLSFDKNELLDIKKSVESAIKETQDKLFLEYLDKNTLYKSVGKTLAGTAIDLLVPGVSAIVTIAKEIVSYFDKGNTRWQGFIVSMRNTNIGRNR